MPHPGGAPIGGARKVHAWLSRYEADGLEGLANRRRRHRPPGPL